jgi:hypothetical protein
MVTAPVATDSQTAAVSQAASASPRVPAPSSSADPPDLDANATDTEKSVAGKVGPIGVPSCDAYIKMWRRCFKDPAAAAAALPGLQVMAQAWRTQARDPAAWTALEAGCKMALDSFPKAACR